MRRVFLILLAVAFVAGGVFATVYGNNVRSAMAADPACTRDLTTDTLPKVGPTCTIVSGTVTRTYTHHGSKSSTDYIVVTTARGTQLSVALASRSSRVFAGASVGSTAVVELVQNQSAFIATSDGMESASNDPHRLVVVAWICFGFGALLGLLAIFGHNLPRSSLSRR